MLILLFFDFLIFFSLLYGAYWMCQIIRSFFYKKEKVIFWVFALILLLIFWGVIFYGSFIAPQLLETRYQSIDLGKTSGKENIKIAFVSDIHAGYYKKESFVRRVVDRVKEEKPDLILLGGDFILGSAENAKYLQSLSELSVVAPVYAVTGNHEYNQNFRHKENLIDKTALLREEFSAWNIKMLDSELVNLKLANQEVQLAGLPDIWTGQADLAEVVTGLNSSTPSLLLCHNPDIILDPQSNNFDLIVSGHTHGGQIRLPWLGSLAPIPDELGRAYDEGLFQLPQNQLFIGRGVGESGPRARLFDRPAVVIIDLNL